MKGKDDIDKYIRWQKEKEKVMESVIYGHATPETRTISYNPPQFLYKYYPPEIYNLSSLADDKIWMSKPNNFNDPYDSAITLDKTVIHESKDLLKILGTYEDVVSQYKNLENKIEEFRNKLIISCYSEIPDSLLMWSHYSKNHQGFCVEYNYYDVIDNVYKKDKTNFIMQLFAPVIYTTKDIVKVSRNSLQNFNAQVLRLLFCKSFDWIYEQEWRQIYICKGALSKDTNGKLIASPHVKSIIMGCKIDTFIEKILHEICEKKGIGLDKMEMDESEFILKRISVLPCNNI